VVLLLLLVVVVEVLLLLLLLLLVVVVHGGGHYVASDRIVPCCSGGCRDRVSLGGRVLDLVLLEERREASSRETGRGRHAMRKTCGKVREQRMRRYLDTSCTATRLLPCATGRCCGCTTITVSRGRGSRGVQP